MITGTVTSEGEAVIRLSVRGPNRHEKKIKAVIDTGYTGWLTLPPDLIAELQLTWSTLGRSSLADGREIEHDIYEGVVVWDRRRRLIDVDESESDPLVGMAMLEGFELNMQVRSRGKVRIQRLSDA
jgi:clan AA aspartic protease